MGPQKADPCIVNLIEELVREPWELVWSCRGVSGNRGSRCGDVDTKRGARRNQDSQVLSFSKNSLGRPHSACDTSAK